MSLIRTGFPIFASIIFNIRMIREGAGVPAIGPRLRAAVRSKVDMADTVVSRMLADRMPPLHADGSTNGSRGSKHSLRHVTREPPAEHDAFNDSANSSILISTLRWAAGDNNSNLVDAAFLLGGLFRRMAQE